MNRNGALIALPVALVCAALGQRADALDNHFDYTSFDNSGTPGADPHFGQNNFNVVNYPSINGNWMMTATDGHRSEMIANNNNLAEFYNWLQQRYDAHTTKDGNISADEIDAYVKSNSPTLSSPKWLIMNEMSTSLWTNATYRAWLIQTATKLKDTYGYNVVTYTTFANPSTNAADWQALAAKSYIAIENYLSGKEIMNNGTDYASRLTWAKAQYAWSKTAYGNLGVSSSRLLLSEHFGNTNATYVDGSGVTHNTGWGRAGIASSDWDTVIQLRQEAIYAAGYPGFLAYGWGANGMKVTEAEQIQHEYYYRTRLVMPGQQPQWLVDNTYTVNGTSIPVSWNQDLNWLGGIPNAAGAIANFYRTNTAARTVTLDGAQTVGTLSFNSPLSYTLSPGAGGSLTFNNSGAGASLILTQSNHVITAPITLADNLAISGVGSLTFSGSLTNSAGKTITKNGTGILTITGAQTHGVNASLVVNAGTVTMSTDAGNQLSRRLNVNAAAGTITFSASQHLAGLSAGTGGQAILTAGGAKAIITSSVSTTGTGKLDLNDNDMIVDYTGASPLTNIRALLLSGRGAPGIGLATWKGAGINSTSASAFNDERVALGYAENSAMPLGAYATFDGQAVDSSSILVKYTRGGDADLDGRVTDSDVTIVGAFYGQATSGHWYLGDFDYSGQCDDADVTILGAYYDPTATPMSPADLTSIYGAEFAAAFEYGRSIGVPEPAFSMFVVAMPLLFRRRAVGGKV